MSVFTWVWKLVNWKQVNHLLNLPEKNFELKLRNWECLIEWLFEDSNMNTLGTASIQILLEICFDIFMNHEIVLIGESKFKPLAVNHWKLFIAKNRSKNPDIETAHPWYPQEKKAAEEPVVSEEATESEQGVDEGEMRDRKDSQTSSKSTEGTEGSLENKISQEFSVETEKIEASNVQYLCDARLSKVLLLLIEAQFCHKNPEGIDANEISFSFLFIRILNMSMFSHLFKDKEWVRHYLKVLLSEEFDQDKFWMYYRCANKGDVEEQVVRVFKRAKFDTETIEDFINLAQSAG